MKRNNETFPAEVEKKQKRTSEDVHPIFTSFANELIMMREKLNCVEHLKMELTNAKREIATLKARVAHLQVNRS